MRSLLSPIPGQYDPRLNVPEWKAAGCGTLPEPPVRAEPQTFTELLQAILTIPKPGLILWPKKTLTVTQPIRYPSYVGFAFQDGSRAYCPTAFSLKPNDVWDACFTPDEGATDTWLLEPLIEWFDSRYVGHLSEVAKGLGKKSIVCHRLKRSLIRNVVSNNDESAIILCGSGGEHVTVDGVRLLATGLLCRQGAADIRYDRIQSHDGVAAHRTNRSLIQRIVSERDQAHDLGVRGGHGSVFRDCILKRAKLDHHGAYHDDAGNPTLDGNLFTNIEVEDDRLLLTSGGDADDRPHNGLWTVFWGIRRKDGQPISVKHGKDWIPQLIFVGHGITEIVDGAQHYEVDNLEPRDLYAELMGLPQPSPTPIPPPTPTPEPEPPPGGSMLMLTVKLNGNLFQVQPMVTGIVIGSGLDRAHLVYTIDGVKSHDVYNTKLYPDTPKSLTDGVHVVTGKVVANSTGETLDTSSLPVAVGSASLPPPTVEQQIRSSLTAPPPYGLGWTDAMVDRLLG